MTTGTEKMLCISQTCIKRPCIKRSPFIKRSVVKVIVQKFLLLITLNVTSIKRSPLFSGRGHLLQSPSEGLSIVFTCIKPALQAATVLVAMASKKKLWRLKLSRRSPIWRPNLLAICLCFFFYNLHPVIITTFT